MCKVEDLPPGKAIEKRILARRVAVFNVNGALFGIEAECKHMKAPLVTGDIDGTVLTCRWHHWKYDLLTGKSLNHPEMKLKRYEVEIASNDIYLLLD